MSSSALGDVTEGYGHSAESLLGRRWRIAESAFATAGPERPSPILARGVPISRRHDSIAKPRCDGPGRS